ncbi:MAG: hypothetical protein ACOX0K_05940 [Oscillospiraceae bacterium]
MKRSAFFPFFALYWGTLILCGGIQIRLKLVQMDYTTGFYTGSRLPVAVFYTVLGLCIALLFLLYLLRRTGGDYPVLRSRRSIAVPAILLGGSILFFTAETLALFPFGKGSPIPMGAPSAILRGLLGLMAGFSFLVSGIQGLRLGRMKGGLLVLAPGVWMLVTLVCRFNAYNTLTTVSDNLLTVLFMLFAAVFLVGHARTLSGLARKDGRNYVIPAGLCASLCGFFVSVPNWIWMAVHHSMDIPAPLLGLAESCFLFMTALYALWFVYHTCASIQEV